MNPFTNPFSEEEQIKNEIEILKLKIEVEFGGIVGMPDANGLPPIALLQFLQNVYDFEKDYQKKNS